MFTLNGDTINWKSSKQEMTVDSTTKSEHIVDLIPLHWDNNGAIVKARGTTVSSKVQTCTQGDTI